MSTENLTFEIPARGRETLDERVAKFNRRGAKLGFAPLSIEVLRAFVAEEKRSDGTTRYRHMIEIKIAGDVPVIAGHTFIAAIQHTPAGNMVKRSPLGADDRDLSAYRATAPICEHCNHKRARKDTFVLVTPEGATKQIGRRCLQIYLGSADPAAALRLWDLLAEIQEMSEESEGGGGFWSWSVSVEDFASAAVAAIRQEGWRPSSFDHSTRLDGRLPERLLSVRAQPQGAGRLARGSADGPGQGDGDLGADLGSLPSRRQRLRAQSQGGCSDRHGRPHRGHPRRGNERLPEAPGGGDFAQEDRRDPPG